MIDAAAHPVMLFCRVGDHVCALPVEQVVETMRPLPVEALGGAARPAFLRGVAIVRGAAVPVIDLATLLTGSPLERSARFVTLRVGERHVAVVVDDVLGLERVPAASLEALPPLLADEMGELVGHLGALDAKLLLVLRASRLVPEAFWRALEEEAEA